MVEIELELTKLGIDLGDVAGVAGKLASYWANRNNRAIQAHWQQTLEEWIIEDRRRVLDVLHELRRNSDDVAALNARLTELSEDPSFARIRDNYGYEASREAIDERRRMLAFAAAGSVRAAASAKLSIAQLARVERTIRELDPFDVAYLKQVSLAENPSIPHIEAHNQHQRVDLMKDWEARCHKIGSVRWEVLKAMQPTGALLVASGCVQILATGSVGEANSAEVTALGEWVLEVMKPYLAAREQETRA
ncbi:MAG: hypothetical protein ACOY0T_09445 [Myxococcota bacterium]